MEFIDDYRSKKKLAERLRKRADAMSKPQQFNPVVTTQGNENFPGMQQANIAAPIAQIGSAIFGNMAENRAQEAEDAQAAARMEALQGIMGGGAGAPGAGSGPGATGAYGAAAGKPTPEQLAMLSELGLSDQQLKLMMPDKAALGAKAQAAATPQGRAILVMQGEMTKEEADAITAQEDAARERARTERRSDLEYAAGLRPKPQGRAESEIEFAQRDPEGYARYLAQRAKAAATAKGSGQSNEYSKTIDREQGKVDVKLVEGESKLRAGVERADKLLKETDDLSEGWVRARQAADAVSEMLPGSPKISNISEQVKLDEQAASQFQLDAMEQMRGFGQVTEAEQAIIRATQFDRYDTPEVRKQKIGVIRDALERGLEKVAAAKERMRTRTSVLPEAGGVDDLDAEMDALMGGQ